MLQYLQDHFNVLNLWLIFFLFIPGDVIVDVTEEVALDLSHFISSTHAIASSGEITAWHY